MNTPAQNEIAILLRTAARAVTDFGWTRGSLQNSQGLCALGAINYAVSGDPNLDVFKRAVDYSSYEAYICDADLPLSRNIIYEGMVHKVDGIAEALAPHLPRAKPSSSGFTFEDMPLATVKLVYFNDHNCTGGEELVQIFTEAAEKIEANA